MVRWQAAAAHYHHTAPRRKCRRGLPCGGLSGRCEAGRPDRRRKTRTRNSGCTPNSRRNAASVLIFGTDDGRRAAAARPAVRAEHRRRRRLRDAVFRCHQPRDPVGGQRVACAAPTGRGCGRSASRMFSHTRPWTRSSLASAAASPSGSPVSIAAPRSASNSRVRDSAIWIRPPTVGAASSTTTASQGTLPSAPPHVAAEVEEQRNDADRRHQRGEARHHVGQRHHLDVLVGDMADLMGEHAGQFARRQRPGQRVGDGDRRIVAAADREGVHHLRRE